MAKINNYAVANLTGQSLIVTINGLETTVSETSKIVHLLRFPEKDVEQFDVTIEKDGKIVNIPNFTVAEGKNSWSTFAFTDNGMVNVFPSSTPSPHSYQ